jgi:hypothetical protein
MKQMKILTEQLNAVTATVHGRVDRLMPGGRVILATAPLVMTIAAAGLLGMPFPSNAYQIVTVNGNLWACQHSCVVMEINDVLWVRDSAGGWVARIGLSGEAVQNDPL